jgi:hypothetical protein
LAMGSSLVMNKRMTRVAKQRERRAADLL